MKPNLDETQVELGILDQNLIKFEMVFSCLDLNLRQWHFYKLHHIPVEVVLRVKMFKIHPQEICDKI